MVALGFVGCAHCHTPWIASVLKARPDVKVKAVFDHDRGRAASCASLLGCAVAEGEGQIWRDADIQGVFVCSETDRHRHDVPAAAAAGKHVFVEKPLATNGRDGFEMALALERAGVIFMTGYRTRSEGIFAFLRDEIRGGHFGTVTRIRYVNGHGVMLSRGFSPEHNWITDPAQAGGGAFLDLGTHALDAILWLMDEEVVAATSMTGQRGRTVRRGAHRICRRRDRQPCRLVGGYRAACPLCDKRYRGPRSRERG
jgi:predicted dehydrogenase